MAESMDRILEALVDHWIYDLQQLEAPVWGTFYAIFMFLKWPVITSPLWLTFRLVVGGRLVSILSITDDNRKEKTND